MKYSKRERKFLNKIKIELIDYCNCNNGYDDKGNQCKCLIIFNFIKELVLSRISRQYWQTNLKEFKIKSSVKMIVLEYLKNLNNALDNKLGFIFYGSNGTGKTSTMNFIGVHLIIKQYKVVYVRMKEVLDNIFKENEILKNRIKEADLILLDEFDKLYHKSKEWNIYNVDDFIREYFDNKSIIFCTNFLGEEEIEEYYDGSIVSKIREFNKFVCMDGEDFRKKLNEKWNERLKDNSFDYMDLYFQAKKWNKNKLKKEQEKYDVIL